MVEENYSLVLSNKGNFASFVMNQLDWLLPFMGVVNDMSRRSDCG